MISICEINDLIVFLAHLEVDNAPFEDLSDASSDWARKRWPKRGWQHDIMKLEVSVMNT